MFRTGRIIGRRFRLVHVRYGNEIIETATFRRPPSDNDNAKELLITEDNEYGTAAEDALRRDFMLGVEGVLSEDQQARLVVFEHRFKKRMKEEVPQFKDHFRREKRDKKHRF